MALHKVRVIEKREDGAVIRLVCDSFDSGALASAAVGGTGSGDPGSAGALKLKGPTWLEVVDLPLLQTADGTAGLFLAAGSVLDEWPGAVVYRSTDAGTTWEEIATVTQRAILGTAETRLAPWAGGNVLDNCSGVIVNVHGGDLASCAWARLLEGDNLCALGDELLRFRTATQLGPRRWLLTDFLRYRGGTERYAQLHVPGERFVLLDRAVVVPLESELLGRQVIYRAVTAGAPVTAGTDVSITEEQEALRPLAPIHLNVAHLGTAYKATWRRRTRVPAPWANGSDAPIDDRPLQFRVRVWFSGDADTINTIVTAPEATFGAGLTLTDHRLEVSQISRSGRDGRAALTTIT